VLRSQPHPSHTLGSPTDLPQPRDHACTSLENDHLPQAPDVPQCNLSLNFPVFSDHDIHSLYCGPEEYILPTPTAKFMVGAYYGSLCPNTVMGRAWDPLVAGYINQKFLQTKSISKNRHAIIPPPCQNHTSTILCAHEGFLPGCPKWEADWEGLTYLSSHLPLQKKGRECDTSLRRAIHHAATIQVLKFVQEREKVVRGEEMGAEAGEGRRNVIPNPGGWDECEPDRVECRAKEQQEVDFGYFRKQFRGTFWLTEEGEETVRKELREIDWARKEEEEASIARRAYEKALGWANDQHFIHMETRRRQGEGAKRTAEEWERWNRELEEKEGDGWANGWVGVYPFLRAETIIPIDWIDANSEFSIHIDHVRTDRTYRENLREIVDELNSLHIIWPPYYAQSIAVEYLHGKYLQVWITPDTPLQLVHFLYAGEGDEKVPWREMIQRLRQHCRSKSSQPVASFAIPSVLRIPFRV